MDLCASLRPQAELIAPATEPHRRNHMKASLKATILGVTALIALVPSRAGENVHQQGTSTRLLQDARATVGIGFSPKMTLTASFDAATVSIEDELVEALEIDEQVTVVGEVQLGELLCDSLTEAENATQLNFAISADEVVIIEKTYYAVLDGERFSDGIARKIWNGVEVESTIEGAHRTVSMAWGEECDVETFLLKITTSYDDGSLFVLKSVPCEAGSSDEICIVEVKLDFKESEKPEITTTGFQSSDTDRRLREAVSGGRELQTTTRATIDVMMLYTETIKTVLGDLSDSQMASTLAIAIASSNQALNNSNIDAEFRLVYAGPTPYDETTTDLVDALYNFRYNEVVAELRACAGADLAQLVGYFGSDCGVGYVFNGDSEKGISVVGGNCIEGFSHTHELGHNLGCYHNREDSNTQTDYAHGWRYCNGSDPYRTIMSYDDDDCEVPRVNYFSSPNLMLYDKPTGQEDADNVNIIELNMAAVADFESPAAAPSACEFATSTPTLTPTPAPSVSFKPLAEPTAEPAGYSTGLVDASERTEVTILANAYDTTNSEEGGCDPDGCVPSNTRDSILTDDSRWSCVKILVNETCRLTYTFDEVQDIAEINIAFYKGDERTRTFEVETRDTSESTSSTEFTSSGETNGFETFSLGSEETMELAIFPASPNEDDWISILEVEIMVP